MANRTIEIRITAANRASSVIDRVVGSLSGLGSAASGASGHVGALGRIMETGLGVAMGNLVVGAFSRIGDALLGFGRQVLGAVGKAQALETSITGLLTEANMFQAVTEARTVAVSAMKMEASALKALSLKRDTATAKIQEQKERIRQLIEQYGAEGLVVKSEQAELAEMIFKRDEMTKTIDENSSATTRYATVSKTTVKQVMSFEGAQAKAKIQAKELLAAIQELAIISPFETAEVERIASVGLMAGMSTDRVKSFTSAWLDFASVHGITGEKLAFAADQFLQFARTSKLSSIDLRQLRNLGVDVGRILSVDLGMSAEELTSRFGDLSGAAKSVFTGMSVDEFNAQVEKSPELVQALFDKFTVYAEKTTEGAAEDLAQTVTGWFSTIHDIVDLGSRNLFQPIVEAVGPTVSDALGKIAKLVTGGKLQEIGIQLGEQMIEYMANFDETKLGKFVGRFADAFKLLKRWLKEGAGPAEALARAMQAIVPQPLWKGIVALGKGLDKFGSVVKRVVKQALQTLGNWFDKNGPAIKEIAGRIAVALSGLLGGVTAESLSAGTALSEVAATILDVGLRAFEGLATVLEFVTGHWDKFVWVVRLFGAYIAGKKIIGGIMMVTRLLSPMSLALTAISVVVGLLKKAWEDNWNGIRDKLTDVWEKIKPAVEAIQNFIGGLLTALTGGEEGELKLADAVSVLGEALLKLGLSQDLVDRIMLLASGIGDLFLAFGSLLEGDIPGAIDNVSAAMGNFIGAILNLPQDKVEAISDFLSDLGNTTYQKALEWWEENGPKIKEGIDAFIEGTVGLAETAYQTALEWWEDHGDAVGKAVGAFAESAEQAATDFGAFLTKLAESGWKTNLEWFKTDGPAIAESMKGIGESIGTIVSAFAGGPDVDTGAMLDNFVENVQSLQEINLDSITEAVKAIDTALEGIGKVAGPASEGLRGFVSSVEDLTGIQELVDLGSALEFITKYMTPMGLPMAFGDMADGVRDLDSATKEAGGIKEFFRGIARELANLGVEMAAGRILVSFGMLPEQMQEIVSGLTSSFAGVGKTIADAIVHGFNIAWFAFTGETLVTTLGSLATNIANALAPNLPEVEGQGNAIITALTKGFDVAGITLKAEAVGILAEKIVSLTTAVSGFRTFIEESADIVSDFFIDLGVSVAKFIRIPEVQSLIDLFKSILAVWSIDSEDAEGEVNVFSDVVTGVFLGLYDSLIKHSIIPDMLGDIVTEFGKLPRQITEILKKGSKQLEKAGKEIVLAVQRGVDKEWEQFIAWLAFEVREIVTTILASMGVESPPDWAVSAGQDIVLGIQLGMEKQFGALGGTMAAMGNIVTGATIPAPAYGAIGMGPGHGMAGGMIGGGSNSYGGDTYNVVINDTQAAAMFMYQARARSAERLNRGMGR